MSHERDDTLPPDVMSELLTGMAPVQPPPSLRARVLQSIAQTPQITATVTVRDREGWCELAPGIRYKMLFADPAANCKSFLLQADAGVTMPPHGHSGFEECLVLEGSFSMGDITLHAGDFHAVGKDTVHDTASTTTGVLVYIRAAMTDYPMINAA